ncbi:MAG: hypothetical protein JST28_19630 [Acidobacteria bacterium]|nr:hypothetical protein [Acidobacteriota bacterium]
MTAFAAGSINENPYFEEWLKQTDVQREREDQLLHADHAHDFERVAELLSFRNLISGSTLTPFRRVLL